MQERSDHLLQVRRQEQDHSAHLRGRHTGRSHCFTSRLSPPSRLHCLFTKTFKVKDLGDAKKFLGLHVQQDLASGTVRLDQSHYALEVVKEYLGDNRISHRPQPMSPDFRVLESDSPSTDEEKKETSQFPYRQLLGSLMYLMVGTRFDIAYAVSQLARVMSNPGVRHWHALKYLLRY